MLRVGERFFVEGERGINALMGLRYSDFISNFAQNLSLGRLNVGRIDVLASPQFCYPQQ